MAATEALYKVKIETDSSSLGAVKKDVDALSDSAAVKLHVDTSGAQEALGALKGDAFAPIGESASKTVRPIKELEAELAALKKSAASETDINVLGNTNQKIKEVESELKHLKSVTEESLNPSPVERYKQKFEGLGEKIKEGIGLGAGIFGLQAIGGVLEGSFEKFKKQEDAERGVELAFDDMGEAGKKAAEDMKVFASARQQVTTFGDEATLKVIQLGKQLGNISDPEKLKKFTIGIQNYAAATGQSMDQVTQSLAAKLDAGGRDRKLGITFDPADAEGNINKFIDATDKKFHGFAEKIAQSPTGAIEQFKNQFGDLEEQVGGLIVSGLTPLIPVVSGVVTVLQDAFKFIQDNKTAIGLLALGAGVLAISMNAGAIGTLAFSGAQKVAALGTNIMTGAQRALNLVMSANPVGLIVTTLLALGAALIYAYEHSETVRKAVDSVWGVLKGLGAFIAAFVKNEVKALSEAFGGVADVVSGLVTLDFSKVKKGVTEVGGALATHVSSAGAGMKAFKGSIEESSKALADQKKGAEEAGDAGKESANKAADAQKALADQIAAANAAYTEQFDSNKKQIDEDRTNFLRQQEYIRTGMANGQKLTEAQIAQYKAANEQTLETAKLRVQINAAHEKDIANFNKAIGQVKEEKKQHEDALEVAKREADAAAKKLEIELRLKAAAEGRSLTSKEELAIAAARADEFDRLVKKSTELSKIGSDGKLSLKVQAEIDTDKIKTLDLAAKVKVDVEKYKADLQTATDDVFKKEIELGFRPKTDIITLLTDQIKRVQGEIDSAKIDLIDPAKVDDATLRIKQLTAKQYDLYRAALDAQAALDKDAADKQKDLAKKTEAEKSEIRLAAEKSVDNVLNSLWQAAFAKRQKIDEADVAEKQAKFASDEDALNKSLRKGELSQATYALKLKALALDRDKYEKSLEGDRTSLFRKTEESLYNDIASSAENYFKQLAAKYVIDALFHSNAEATKTATTIAGTAARETANAGETASNVTNAGSSMLGAVTKEIEGAITFLGPIAGPVAGLATAGILMAAMKGMQALLGFESGGVRMGIQGEAGPEIVGPVRDFSNYTGSLISTTARTVMQYLNQQGAGAPGKSRMTVDVNGRLRQRGRDLDYSLERDKRARRTERLVNSD